MNNKKSLFKKKHGFTLIELTIVMFIIGLLLAGLLAPLSLSIEQERRNATELQLNEIKEALIGFTITNGRLPCPDCRDAVGNCANAGVIVNDGLEDLDNTGLACAASDGVNLAQGNLPWVTLGVDRFDAWGNQMSYYADHAASDLIGNNSDGCGGNTENLATIALCANGAIEIDDLSDDCAGVAVDVADDVSALVISHGANALNQGNGIIQAPGLCNEFENFDTFNVAQPYNTSFVVRDYTEPNGNALGYDDLAVWITPGVLKSKLMSAGLLP